MILTKYGIQEALEKGTVVITPPPKPEHIGPNSVDLHLAAQLLRYHMWHMPHRPERPLDVRVPRQTFPEFLDHIDGPDLNNVILRPGTLYLGRTIERTFTPHHVPYIGGRSSIGRLGISIHCTAGFGDVGFDGTWTLEITVVHPIKIYAGMRIAQLWLFEGSHELKPEDQYRGRYQGQVDPTASRFAGKAT